MTAVHARAARREREAAKALGSTRVRRDRFERAPDVVPVVTPLGLTIIAESKTRKRLPALTRKALEQARSYLPSAIPVAIVSQTGGRAIASAYLDDFARLIGTAPANIPAQPALALIVVKP